MESDLCGGHFNESSCDGIPYIAARRKTSKSSKSTRIPSSVTDVSSLPSSAAPARTLSFTAIAIESLEGLFPEPSPLKDEESKAKSLSHHIIERRRTTNVMRMNEERTARREMPVLLRVYDFSHGRATQWSKVLLGVRIEGVWHTGIQVFGHLFHFYGGGIYRSRPEKFDEFENLHPVKIHHLGYTSVTRSEFMHFLGANVVHFTEETYDLVEWNCNHFSDFICRFLLKDRGVPPYILSLPSQIMKTRMGRLAVRIARSIEGYEPLEFSNSLLSSGSEKEGNVHFISEDDRKNKRPSGPPPSVCGQSQQSTTCPPSERSYESSSVRWEIPLGPPPPPQPSSEPVEM